MSAHSTRAAIPAQPTHIADLPAEDNVRVVV